MVSLPSLIRKVENPEGSKTISLGWITHKRRLHVGLGQFDTIHDLSEAVGAVVFGAHKFRTEFLFGDVGSATGVEFA